MRRTRLRLPRRWGMVLLPGVLGVAAIGCYGRFPVTRAIYRLNGQASDSKWVKSAVMWVFAFPLYLPAAATDVGVFNLVEFWTGATLDFGGETPPPRQPRPRPHGGGYVLAASAGSGHFAATDPGALRTHRKPMSPREKHPPIWPGSSPRR